MANEEEESLLSLCSLEEAPVDHSDGDKDIVNYISSQASEMNDLKRRKLDSFVLQLSQSYLEPAVTKSAEKKNDLLWSVKYTPQNSDQLCLHPKKIQDVKNKLREMIINKNQNMIRILVLNGPTGSGKSITAKVLCNEIMMEMKKNNEMKGLKLGSLDDRLDNIVEFNYLSTSTNSSSYFTDFLEECKMLTGDNSKCILIEELPNLYHKETHMNFQKGIMKWIETAKIVDLPPMVICVTEYDIDSDGFQNKGDASFTIENTFKIETIFGYQIMQLENIYWERVTFNPIAKTYLKKALTRVANGEDLPKNRTLDTKINELSLLGDIRNSINVLEYWFKFFLGLQNEEILGKESGINLFHCVGKLIYGTKHFEKELGDYRKRANLNSLLMKQSSKDYQSVESISSNLLTALLVNDDTQNSLTKVNLCCLENYEKLKPRINNLLLTMLDDWSLVDSMTVNNFNDLNLRESLGLLSCLSTRLSSSKLKSLSANGSSSKLLFSRDNKTKKKKRNTYISINEYTNRRAQRLCHLDKYSYLSSLEALSIDGYYQSAIIGSFKARQRMFSNGYKINNIERLGGELNKSLYADTNFEIEQEQEHVYDLKDIENQFYGIQFSEDVNGDYYSGEDDPLEFSENDSFSDDELEKEDERNEINSSCTPTIMPLPKLYEEDDSFSDDELGI